MMDKYFKNQLHFYTSNKQQYFKKTFIKASKKGQVLRNKRNKR